MKYCLLVCFVFVMGGCTSQGGDNAPVRIGTASGEKIQDSGSGVSAPDSSGYDPVRQHLLARKDVDPVHVDKQNRYTKNVDNLDVAALKGDGSGNFRVLKLEPKLEDNAPLKTALDETRAKTQSAALSVNSALSSIQNVRMGQHPGKTRFVLDASSKTAFGTRFEDGGRVFVVNLPDVSWNARVSESFAQNPFVGSYQVRNISEGGAELFVSLRKPSKLLSQMLLPPNDTYSNYRIVLDVAPL